MTETRSKPKRCRRWRRWLAAAILVVLLSGGGLYSIQRWVLHNFHEVVLGEVYRSAQPGVRELRAWIPKYGLRTIVNLRHDTWRDPFADEKTLAERLGVRLISVPLTNANLPPPALLRRLVEVLEAAERPMLLHCHAGADRCGVASVLAAMAVGGQDYDTARKQLSLRYLHFDPLPNRVGAVLGRYESYCKDRGLGTGGWQQFKHWALNVYQDDS